MLVEMKNIFESHKRGSGNVHRMAEELINSGIADDFMPGIQDGCAILQWLGDTGWQFELTERRLLGNLHKGSEEAVTFVINLECALESFREQRRSW
jgi:hypothetical protein